MAQEIYQWARNLAVYYIILTALMHIMPDPRYSRYVRSFMGILLILIVTSPLLNLLHLEEQMDGLFHKKILEEEFAQPSWGQVQGEEIAPCAGSWTGAAGPWRRRRAAGRGQ